MTELFPSALYDSEKVFTQKACSSKITTWSATKCFVIFKENIVFQYYIIIFITISSDQTSKNSSVCSLTESIITVDTLWTFSSKNVTIDRVLFCKYAGISSAYVLYQDKNNFEWDIFSVQFRNKEIMISRSSLNPVQGRGLKKALPTSSFPAISTNVEISP